jgi:hypothetical protein
MKVIYNLIFLYYYSFILLFIKLIFKEKEDIIEVAIEK